MPIDVVGYAVDGLIALSIAAPPMKTDTGKIICDLVEVAGADVLHLFRSHGAKPEKVLLRRVRRHGESEWHWISEPNEGLVVMPADVLVTRTETLRFERKHTPNEAATSESQARRRPPGPGVPPKYDWDTFFAAMTRRIFVDGLPKTQGELVREMLDWFQSRNGENTPDESTVRRKIAIVWRELKRLA
ncbi:MAG: hypothetical protein AB7K64_12885 [Variibacter sp.]